MTKSIRFKKMLECIEEKHWALVYPLKGKDQWPSLWHHLYPRRPMNWSWDSEADPRISQLWADREDLASQKLAVYTKYFRDRATFFSKPYFVSLLREHRPWTKKPSDRLSRWLLDSLLDNTPQSTKMLKRRWRSLDGSAPNGNWDRSLKTLFRGLWIVGLGEEDDGAFPSLRLGATELAWEELWQEAQCEGDGFLKAR
jgi:hypothetical protein